MGFKVKHQQRNRLVTSPVDLDVTPKPSGVSFIDMTITPWCSGQSSDHRPTCAFTTCLLHIRFYSQPDYNLTYPPYRNGISPLLKFGQHVPL
jgi:hypothetical protein